MPTLLAPRVSAPLSECSQSIQVKGQVPGSTVFVAAGNEIVATGVSLFSEVTLLLLPTATLKAGQHVTATQVLGSDESDVSPEPVIVQAKPASVGPVVFDSTIYECGSCAAVSGAIPGATVEVHATTGPHPGLRGSKTAAGGSAVVSIDPAAVQGDHFYGVQVACGDAGPHTPMQDLLSHTLLEKLSPPTIKTPLYACQQFVGLQDLFPGATVHLHRSEGDDIQACIPFHTGRIFGIKPLIEGETLRAEQVFARCHAGSKSSEPVKVEPADKLPAPVVIGGLALCKGTKSITITNLKAGATVRIFVDGKEIGQAGAPTDAQFPFPVPPLDGSEVTAQQGLCDHWSQVSKPVKVFSGNPAKAPAIPGPLYECAGVVRVNAARGSWVTVFSKMLGAPIGQGFAPVRDQADVLVSPLLLRGDDVTATVQACGDESVSSKALSVRASPAVSAPQVAPNPVTHSVGVKVTHAIPGAYVEIFINEFWRGGKYVAAEQDSVPISGELVTGDIVAARQRLCARVSQLSGNETVVPPPPVARFAANPTSGDAPLTVAFTNHSTGAITGYEWYFDSKGNDVPPPDSSDKNPGPQEYKAGTHTVVLNVLGPGGNSSVKHQIEVSEPQPSPPIFPGYSEVEINNCYATAQLSIWVRDETAGTDWEHLKIIDPQGDNSGMCPADEPGFSMELQNASFYHFKAVVLEGDCEDKPDAAPECTNDLVVVGQEGGGILKKSFGTGS